VGALALSRGAERKPYRHVDPNEDAALLLADEAGMLLAVADGFNGVPASELALRAVGRAAAELLVPEFERFAAAVLALLARIAQRLDPESDSRTCLLLAALSGNRCHFASVGDSSLFRATSGEPVSLASELFLGRSALRRARARADAARRKLALDRQLRARAGRAHRTRHRRNH
jgi:serine/threonine protein phosphatase PrpC